MSRFGQSLLSQYRALICDLDGVVYRGPVALPGAIEALNAVVAAEVGLVFATNNAARSPEVVGENLQQMGLGPSGWSVVTSAQAAATFLASRLDPGATVLAIGGAGVGKALREVGLTPVNASELSETTMVEAVVQGAGLSVNWRDLTEVAYAVQAGAIWVATNLDATVPTSRGIAPGNGAFVGAVRSATTVVPHATGKPAAALFDLARVRLGTPHSQTLVVGDRLDTDIEGAQSAALDSLCVLGGACTLEDLAFASVEVRPTYAAFGLAGVLGPLQRLVPKPSPDIDISPQGWVTVRRNDDEPLTVLWALLSAAWAAVDAGDELLREPAMWEALEVQLAGSGFSDR